MAQFDRREIRDAYCDWASSFYCQRAASLDLPMRLWNRENLLGSNLRRGTTVSCGCKHKNNLTGQRIGKLTVIGRSDKYGSRGKRQTQLWECVCECGAITYKATDTLTNPDISMCQNCAAEYAITRARENLGFEGGTQITKIKNRSEASENLSGVRGVYLDRKTGKYRARLKFRGKLYNLGCYTMLEDAVKARRRGEEEIFDTFLADCVQTEVGMFL